MSQSLPEFPTITLNGTTYTIRQSEKKFHNPDGTILTFQDQQAQPIIQAVFLSELTAGDSIRFSMVSGIIPHLDKTAVRWETFTVGEVIRNEDIHENVYCLREALPERLAKHACFLRNELLKCDPPSESDTEEKGQRNNGRD